MSAWRKTTSQEGDSWLQTTCDMCLNCCGIVVHRVNGRVESIQGDPSNPYSKGKVCAKGASGFFGLYNPSRVTAPLIRTNPKKGIGTDPGWKEISWEEALNLVADRLRKVREDDPRKLMVVSFDVASQDLIQSFTYGFGSPNYTPWSADYFCGNGVHPVTYLAHGSFHSEPDLDYCNYCILFGTQFGHGANENPTGGTSSMQNARMRGMKLVVIDPVCNAAGSKADLWVPVRPGTDAVVALAILNQLLNELKICDSKFLSKCTNAPYLIRADGHYARDKSTGKPLVMHPESKEAVPFDSEGERDELFPIEGKFEIGDGFGTVSPAFQLLKDSIRRYTPEYAHDVSTASAEAIRRIAREFGDAAAIGKTVVIKGVELPYRPVSVWWYRGPSAHKHAMLSCWALQLLTVVVGAIDVPGGSLGSPPVEGPWWSPGVSSDGLLVPPDAILAVRPAYPARKVERPHSLTYLELFPVAPYVPTFLALNLLHPETYRPPYVPEILIHCRSNIMMTSADPQMVGEILQKIPFMVSFATEIDETCEFADVIIPDLIYLERLDLSIPALKRQGHGTEPWWWSVPQPIVDPPFRSESVRTRHFVETLYEIATRAGFLADINRNLNKFLKLKEKYSLSPDIKYDWEEIADRRVKSTFGDDHDLDWFRANGVLLVEKSAREAYPRPFIQGRIPLYLEHFLQAGEEVKAVTEQMDMEWDVSDYQAVPDWKPCPSFDKTINPEYDLYVANFKLAASTLSFSGSNPMLNRLASAQDKYSMLINAETARRKGLNDGESVSLETPEGNSITGRIHLTERIHPEVIGIPGAFGHWAKGMPKAKGRGSHFNSLIPITAERIDYLSGALDSCVRVKVSKRSQSGSTNKERDNLGLSIR